MDKDTQKRQEGLALDHAATERLIKESLAMLLQARALKEDVKALEAKVDRFERSLHHIAGQVDALLKEMGVQS